MKNRTIIIAEAGVNHNGDIEIAKRLIDVAVEAKVDFIKFQSFTAEKLVSPKAKKADYQHKNIGDNDDSQFNMLKRLELSHENHLVLMKYCSEKKIKFLSTAFDIEGLHYLNHLDLPLFKVPSGEITNYPYLKTIAQFGKPVILSTGMSTEDEIRDAINIFLEFGLTKELITVLHCNTEYPTPMKDVNLNAMISIRNMFQVKVGYSDHTLGIEIPIAAVAIGATVIEKHFTLDRSMKGPDHAASLEPTELIQLVKSIRNIEMAMGSGIKEPSPSELKNMTIARKSIHAARDIEKGSVIMEQDLVMLRPGDGISPMEMNFLIGKKLLKSIARGQKIDYNCFS